MVTLTQRHDRRQYGGHGRRRRCRRDNRRARRQGHDHRRQHRRRRPPPTSSTRAGRSPTAAETSWARTSAPAASSARRRSSPTPSSARSSTTAACRPAPLPTARSSRPRPCCQAAPPPERASAGPASRGTTSAGSPGRPRRPSDRYEPQYASNATPNQVFVENLYEVLLNRRADPGGLAADISYLNHGNSPVSLVQLLEGSPEYLGRQAMLLIRRYLDRAASPSEVTNVASYLGSGHTPEQAAAIFINSNEFLMDYQTQDGFVEALYQTVFDRAAEPDEVAGWDQALASGTTRATMTNLFFSIPAYIGGRDRRRLSGLPRPAARRPPRPAPSSTRPRPAPPTRRWRHSSSGRASLSSGVARPISSRSNRARGDFHRAARSVTIRTSSHP